MFLYDKGKLPSINDSYLYHFTTADSLFKILKNMTLLMSSFNDLNDLNEKEVNFIWQNWRKGLEVKKYIVEHCQLISFSKNFLNSRSLCDCGCNHPRMWAQYANNNKGCCIVINEKKLLKINKDILRWVFFDIEDVAYTSNLYNSEPKDVISPEAYVQKNYKGLFFEKQNDWKQEDERRFFCIDGPKFLSIKNCIEFICLGYKFTDENYNRLIDVLSLSVDKDYVPLKPHDFTIQTNKDGRCIAVDYAFKIKKLAEKRASMVNKYLNIINEK